MRGLVVGALTIVLVPAASAAGVRPAPLAAPASGLAGEPSARLPAVLAQLGPPTPIEGSRMAILEYVAPTSATWGPSPTAPPTFAFGRPAEVQLVVPGGYHVRQAVPVDQANEHATYVSQQLGHPIAVTIPDPAGGPPRVTYVGRQGGDPGR